MLRSSHDACGCSTQTTSTINLKRSTLHPHEGQADRPNTPSDSVNLGSNPGPPAKHLPDMSVYFQFPQSPEKSLYFRVLAPRRRIGDNQRRQTPECGAGTAAGSLEAVFDPSDVEHCSGIGAASGRRKTEEPPLLLPIMRQIPGEHDEPCGRQLDGLLADKNRANDFRREIRETHEPRHI